MTLTEKTRKRKMRVLLRSQGVDLDSKPVKVTKDRLSALTSMGFSSTAIASVLSIDESTVRAILNRDWPTVRITTQNQVKRLSEHQIFREAPETSYVASYASKRRIQALMAIGWPRNVISAEIVKQGCSSPECAEMALKTGDRIEAGKHRAISRVYDLLSMTAGPNKKTITAARKNGWAPPMAWDDIDAYSDRPRGVL